MKTTAFVIAILAVIVIGCTADSDGDDHDDAGDDDEASGCHEVINPGADDVETAAADFTTTDVADCIPEGLDAVHVEQLTVLLEGYLGQYHSEVGTVRTITCRPDGEWELPNYEVTDVWCGSNYKMPIRVQMEEVPGVYQGYIQQDVSGINDNMEMPFWSSGQLVFFLANDDVLGARSNTNDGVVWEFEYADSSPPAPPEDERIGFITWTKDEAVE